MLFEAGQSGQETKIGNVLALRPDIMVQFRLPNWLGRPALFQDTAGTTPVTASSQRIGVARNLGTLGGQFVADNDARRPTYDGVGGVGSGLTTSDGSAMNFDTPSVSQPMTHILWVDDWGVAENANNDYPVDSKNGSTVRHQPFGRTTLGIIRAACPSFGDRFTTMSVLSGRIVTVTDGASSTLQVDGTINLAAATINPGTNAMDGVTLFNSRSRSNAPNLRIRGYARFPRILPQAEVDSLTINL